MEHPFLDISKIKEEYTLEELQSKISDLLTKLSVASRTGNTTVVNQLNMVLECYQRAFNELIDEKFGNDGDDDIRNTHINITK